VLYGLHPWGGREVVVHAMIEKADGAFFSCTLDGLEAERWLEIPAWMFDRAACPGDVRFLAAPRVSLEALSALSVLLDQALKPTVSSSNVPLLGAFRASRDQNRGEAHGTEDHAVGDRKTDQAASRFTADGSVQGRVGENKRQRANMDRPAGGRARCAGRADHAANPGAFSGERDAVSGAGGQP
jgi:hypothetical protein